MSRVINPDSAGKERTRLTKAILIAIRELARQKDPSTTTRSTLPGRASSEQDQIAVAHDLAAFIALALQSIAEGIDVSVAAWEKRDYWIKADRFRMEWAWAGLVGEKMKKAVLAEDWGEVAMLSAQIAQKLQKVKISENHRMGTPWVGAYQQLKQDVIAREDSTQ